MKVSKEIINALMELGFSSYQAKTYIGLVLLGGKASAPEISKESGVPKARIYDVLEEMSTEPLKAVAKLPTEDVGKIIYVATPPDQLLNQLLKEKQGLASKVISILGELKNIPPIETLLVTLKNKVLTSEDIRNALVVFVGGVEEERVINELKDFDTLIVPVVINTVIPRGMAVIAKKTMVTLISINPISSSEILSFHSTKLVEMLLNMVKSLRPNHYKDDFLKTRKVIFSTYGLSLVGSGKFSAHIINETFIIGITKTNLEIYVHNLIDLSIPLTNLALISFKDDEFVEISIVDKERQFLGSLMLKVLDPEELMYQLEVMMND